MDEIETTSSSKPTSAWIPALLCSVVAGFAVAAYTYTMGDHLTATVKADAVTETTERNKLSARMDAAQSNLETISSQPKADTDAISTQFTEVNSKLSALADRVSALEKKPEPAPVAAAPVVPAAAPASTADSAALKLAALSGKSFSSELNTWQKRHPNTDPQLLAPLIAESQSGIPSEADMNSRLREALDDAVHMKKTDDASLIGKINTHLAGLVSIRKAADSGPYAKLRADVMRDDIATLTASVEKLSDEDRKPLEAWLTAAHARRDALAALTKLDQAEAE